MQSLFLFAALLLVAGTSAEHHQEVSNAQTGTGPQVDQTSHVTGHSSAFESGPQHVFGAPHNQQHQSAFASGPVVGFEPNQPMAAHYFSPPAGMVQVVGSGQQSPVTGEQQSAFKPTGTFQTVRHYSAASAVAPAGSGAEQYGQPESAGVPPNYKPFGSWGLYIGGNPADGYYTNYYKALSGSVADKQQAGDQATAVAPTTRGATSAQTFTSNFGPAGVASPQQKQGPFYPSNQAVSYQDQSYQGYPYGEYYTPADLNSGSRVTVQSMPSTYSGASSYSTGPSPVSPTGFAMEEPTGAAMFYAGGGDFSGKKSTGPVAFGQREVHVPASPAKGYYQAQQRTYYAGQTSYQQQAPQQASGASSFEAPSSGAYHQQQSTYQTAAPAPQVVAYPVPVGSQMVGSQPGVDGAFQPYGVHAFTRYAVKPTVVSPEQTTYYQTGAHSASMAHFPVYRQYYSYPQPLGFYGYPLSQLHYSSGASAFAPAQTTGQAAPSSPATVAAQQQQQQQQQHAAVAAAVANAPHPGPEPAPVQAPAPGPAPGPVQGPTAVVEHAGPVGPAHAPVAFFEAASSEKSETSQKDQASEKKAKVQPNQQQQQQQKSN